MRSQVVEFSCHLGDTKFIDAFSHHWDYAKFIPVIGTPEAEEQMVIMYFVVESKFLMCYVYVHEDDIM